ncbi:hypothetical protein BKA70DRAFT_70415 [Coprinopsis sp. MPI-PUGE-AT-0042]|nr:hypothetical protein BKA70DRAFT_70415 [Coprinopsis sp. MPI-PUGE-AT-0042]
MTEIRSCIRSRLLDQSRLPTLRESLRSLKAARFSYNWNSIIFMTEDQGPNNNCSGQRGLAHDHIIYHTSMFHRCDGIAFHNCHFTCFGGHYNRSDVHNVYLQPPQSLPFPISTPNSLSTPRDHGRDLGPSGVAKAAVFAVGVCLLIVKHLLS